GRPPAAPGVTRPAALGLWVLAGLVVALASNDPVPRAVLLAAAWALLARRRMPGRRLRPLAIGVVVLSVVTAVINGLLSHTGSTVLVVVPAWLPLVGGDVTVEAFAYGAAIAVGLAAAVSVAATLSLVIEPADLVDALPWFLARTGAAVGAALNFVPAVASSLTSVRDAQRLRGWQPRGAAALVDLAVPVLLGAIERSVQLAEAMEARAFGSGGRTRASGRERSARNAVVAGGSALVMAGFVVASLLGARGAWYPYPTLSVPSLAPALLAPAVLLGVLAMVVPDGTA
ncbi:MAG: energy-coupling factor transporter transmembrane component T, partial [Acidimicrobiales bacterium]